MTLFNQGPLFLTIKPTGLSFAPFGGCSALLNVVFSLLILAVVFTGKALANTDPNIPLTGEERAWLLQHPEISIAYDGDFPPYSFREEDGSISGFSVELFSILSKKLGVSFKPHSQTQWKSLYKAAQEKQVDLVATMVEREERRKWFNFTSPYISKSLVIITRDDNTDIGSKFDLSKRKVALVKDYQYAKRILKEFPDITPLSFNTMLDALNAVSVGEADAAVSFIGAGHFYRTKYLIANLKYAAIYDSNGSPESIAIRKDWPLLRSILNKTLASIPEGQIQALRAKWLPVDYLNENRQILLTEEERSWLDQHPEIRLGVDPEFAPFEFVEEGQYLGLASDYIALLNRRLGINMSVTHGLSWAEVTRKAKNKELDVLPAVGLTEERKKYFNYSRPYLSFHRVIITQSDFPFITGLDDLRSHTVAVQENSSHHGYLRENSNIQAVGYGTLNEALLALSGGEVDAFVGNVASTSYWIRKLNLSNLKVAAPVSREKQNLHFAVRKDWPELIAIIQKGLDSITIEEEEAIRRKWTSIKVDENLNFALLIRVAGILGSIMILVLLWNFMLKRKVDEQTSLILHSAHYDPLTDTPNRFLISDRLAERISVAKKNDFKVALMSVDLDEFKKINDTFSHAMGDRVLKLVAERLSSILREGDTLGRLSGDQFLVLVSGFHDIADLGTLTSRILKQFQMAFQVDDKVCMLSASIGISVYPFDGSTADELLKNADSATHVAKETSRGSYAFYTKERNQRVTRQIEVESALRNALLDNELYMVFQPKVHSENKQISGFEALLRWHNKRLGNVSPDEFIPIAEKNGMIEEVGEFAIRQSIASLSKLQAEYGSTVTMAINISPVQFNSPTLPDLFVQCCTAEGVLHGAIEIEITEGVLLSSQSAIDFALTKITELGITLAMDDFGQGYSSLSNLRKYNFRTLKIDREFVGDLPHGESDCKLVSSIILMAHGLGIKVVAEGVETAEQSEFLVECGCDFLQGWHYGKPKTLQELIPGTDTQQ